MKEPSTYGEAHLRRITRLGVTLVPLERPFAKSDLLSLAASQSAVH